MGARIKIIKTQRDIGRVGKIALMATVVQTCVKKGEGKVPVPENWRIHFPSEDPGQNPSFLD